MITEELTIVIRESIREKRLNDARQYLAKLQVHEISSLLEILSPAMAAIAFRLLDRQTMLQVFETMPPEHQADIIESLTNDEAVRMLDSLDADESVQLLEEMPAKVVKRMVAKLSSEKRQTVNAILNYPDGSAGRRMNPDAFTARRGQTVGETLAAIRASELSAEDLVDVAEEEASDLMYQKAGLRDIADKKDHIFSKRLTQGNILYPVRVRILFLFVTLLGGLIVGGVIDTFEDTLEAIIAAAIFIPLIMDMGGNVGTQSTTIFARGFALGHIDLRRFWKYFFREGAIGITIGAFLGTLGGFIAYLWQGAPNDIPQLGFAVGFSLFTVITLGAMLGFALPYIMIKLGFDHAPGADPFITTIKDFTGLSLYFFLVTTLIGVAAEDEDVATLLQDATDSAIIQTVDSPPVYEVAGYEM